VLLGSGPNAIVLSHEFRANLCNWLPFAQQLASRGYRVLAYDSRPFASPVKPVHLERDVVGAERELVRRGATRVLIGGASAGAAAIRGDGRRGRRTARGGAVLPRRRPP